MNKIKAALILDNGKISKWQLMALEQTLDLVNIDLILNCKNTKIKRNLFKHCIYYILNQFTLRNSLTISSDFDTKSIEILNFNSIYKGNWQSIPKVIQNELANREIKLIIKFGMSLMNIDGILNSICILSYHHGDPSHYRGRPAGFYEILNQANSVGIIVQSLTNKLDGGDIFAKAFSKIYPHSYKETALNFYVNSIPMLRKAIINFKRDKYHKQKNFGKNYRLPSNILTIWFISNLLINKISRLIKGIFYEKKWNIGLFNSYEMTKGENCISINEAIIPRISEPYIFFADPFISRTGDYIYIEALNRFSGKGSILQLGIKGNIFLKPTEILTGNHFSYPFFIEEDNQYLIPECSEHSNPFIINLNTEEIAFLKGLENLRVVDPTILKLDNLYYLFCGLHDMPSERLYIFFSNNLKGTYIPHPQNPVLTDPFSGRMGGSFAEVNGRLIRFGQNNCKNYGNGLVMKEITSISKEEYHEKYFGEIKFDKVCGPHTISRSNKNIVLDFYKESFSFLAWYRRLIKLISTKKQ